MARDTQRYVYFNVAIPRTSETLQKLLDEANETGIHPARLVALRVSDWYKGSHQGNVTQMQPSASSTSASSVEDIAAQNADAALDAWS